MERQQVNSIAGWTLLVLAVLAFLTVMTGFSQPPHADEDTAAHIFQISVVLLAPALLVFLGTADWRQPWRALRPLRIPAAALVFAFSALYYLEHYRWR